MTVLVEPSVLRFWTVVGGSVVITGLSSFPEATTSHAVPLYTYTVFVSFAYAKSAAVGLPGNPATFA